MSPLRLLSSPSMLLCLVHKYRICIWMGTLSSSMLLLRLMISLIGGLGYSVGERCRIQMLLDHLKLPWTLLPSSSGEGMSPCFISLRRPKHIIYVSVFPTWKFLPFPLRWPGRQNSSWWRPNRPKDNSTKIARRNSTWSTLKIPTPPFSKRAWWEKVKFLWTPLTKNKFNCFLSSLALSWSIISPLTQSPSSILTATSIKSIKQCSNSLQKLTLNRLHTFKCS